MIDLAASRFKPGLSSRISFAMDFIRDFVDLFLIRRISFCRARFIADLWLANVIFPFLFPLSVLNRHVEYQAGFKIKLTNWLVNEYSNGCQAKKVDLGG